MARTRLATVAETLRSGLGDVPSRAAEVAEEIAERVGEAIDVAGSEGRKMSRKLGKDLTRRFKIADSVSRENPYILALGALAVGLAVGYLLTRDRSPKVEDEEEAREAESV